MKMKKTRIKQLHALLIKSCSRFLSGFNLLIEKIGYPIAIPADGRNACNKQFIRIRTQV